MFDQAENRRLALVSAVHRTEHVRIDPNRVIYVEDHPRSRGSYGEVYYCLLDGMREVAVKKVQLKPQDEPSSERLLRHLLREVIPWYDLKHPNISPFIGYIFTHESARMISEWQPYGDVLKYLRVVPSANRMKLIREAAEGLSYLHSRSPSVIHGDLKPENVLVGADGVARLTDFGLSIVLEDTLFRGLRSSSNFRGTVMYADPALLRDQPKTVYTDLWAFGWLAYELITSRQPYQHLRLQKDLSIFMAVYERKLPSPETESINSPYSDIVWPLLQACWSPNNEDRWSAAYIAWYLRKF